MLRLDKVSKQHGKQILFLDATAAVFAGERIGLVGPNGAGKSTLLRLAAGVLLPTAGEVAVGGADPYAEPGARARVGFLGHESFLEPAEEAGAQVEFCHAFRGGGAPGPAALREALELDEVWDLPAAALSRGYTRRVELACVMAGGPDLLLLDEPLGGLDRARRQRLAGLVRGLLPAAAVLVATHRPEDLRALTPRRARLEGGQLGAIEDLPGDAAES